MFYSLLKVVYFRVLSVSVKIILILFHKPCGKLKNTHPGRINVKGSHCQLDCEGNVYIWDILIGAEKVLLGALCF